MDINLFQRGTKNVININNKFYNVKLLPLICYEIIYPGKINIKKQNVDLISELFRKMVGLATQ
jgi:apolipoprotein N-acyltransferase